MKRAAPCVVLETGDHSVTSRGDAAMLAVTISLLRRAWPEASIGVVTEARTRLALLELSVTPLREGGIRTARLPRVATHVPRRSLDAFWAVTQRHTRWYRAATLIGRALPPRGAVFSADDAPAELAIATGGGYMCDMDEPRALGALDLLERVSDAGGVTAMTSQGVGPISSARLLARVAEVAPRIDRMMLRERVTGLPLLERLGMSSDKVVVPGDDAILYSRPPLDVSTRRSIGISFRPAPYLALDGLESRIADGIGLAARRLGAPVRPVTSCEWADGDRIVNRSIANHAPSAEPDIRRSDGPDEFATAFRECRVVVTSLYHAAVLAVSQGVPAVCIASSAYPMSKYVGLADLYGDQGLTLIDASGGVEPARLAEAIEHAWEPPAGQTDELASRTETICAAILAEYERLTALVAMRFDHVADPLPLRGARLGSWVRE